MDPRKQHYLKYSLFLSYFLLQIQHHYTTTPLPLHVSHLLCSCINIIYLQTVKREGCCCVMMLDLKKEIRKKERVLEVMLFPRVHVSHLNDVLRTITRLQCILSILNIQTSIYVIHTYIPVFLIHISPKGSVVFVCTFFHFPLKSHTYSIFITTKKAVPLFCLISSSYYVTCNSLEEMSNLKCLHVTRV